MRRKIRSLNHWSDLARHEKITLIVVIAAAVVIIAASLIDGLVGGLPVWAQALVVLLIIPALYLLYRDFNLDVNAAPDEDDEDEKDDDE